MSAKTALLASAKPQLVRINGYHDLLSIVPCLLGFEPAESLVVVFVGDGGVVGATARVDLAEVFRPASLLDLAQLLGDRARAEFAHAATIAVYTDLPTVPPPMVGEVLYEISASLNEVVERIDLWVVGRTRYWSLGRDLRRRPHEGFDVSNLESTTARAQMVLKGINVAGSREDRYRIPAANKAARDRARAAATRCSSKWDAAMQSGPDAVGLMRRESYCDWIAATAAVKAGVELSPTLAGRLAAACSDRWVRDCFLTWCTPGGPAIAEKFATASATPTDTELMLAAIAGPLSQNPAKSEASTGQRVLEAVLAHSSRNKSVDVLALLAFLAWWQGDGAGANIRCKAALEIDKTHTLTNLVARALLCGIPPAWVSTPRNHVDFG